MTGSESVSSRDLEALLSASKVTTRVGDYQHLSSPPVQDRPDFAASTSSSSSSATSYSANSFRLGDTTPRFASMSAAGAMFTSAPSSMPDDVSERRIAATSQLRGFSSLSASSLPLEGTSPNSAVASASGADTAFTPVSSTVVGATFERGMVAAARLQESLKDSKIQVMECLAAVTRMTSGSREKSRAEADLAEAKRLRDDIQMQLRDWDDGLPQNKASARREHTHTHTHAHTPALRRGRSPLHFGDDTGEEEEVDMTRLREASLLGAGAVEATRRPAQNPAWLSPAEAQRRGMTIKSVPSAPVHTAPSSMERERKVKDEPQQQQQQQPQHLLQSQQQWQQQQQQRQQQQQHDAQQLWLLQQQQMPPPLDPRFSAFADETPLPPASHLRSYYYPPPMPLPVQARSSKVRADDLPKYTREANSRKFFKDLEAKFAIYGVPDTERTHYFYLTLPDGLKEFAQDHLFGLSWDQAKKKFEERFGTVDALADARDEFESCNQDHLMSVVDYLTAFESKAAAADKRTDTQEMAQTFLRRMLKPLQRQVVSSLGIRKNYSLDEVFRLARQFERLEVQGQRQGNPRTTRPALFETPRSALTCNYCRRTGHLQQDCRTRQFDLGRAAREPTSSAPPAPGSVARPHGGSRSAGATVDRSKITCFNCNKQGHYASDCPSKTSTPRPTGHRGDRVVRRVTRVVSDGIKSRDGAPFRQEEEVPVLLSDSDDEDPQLFRAARINPENVPEVELYESDEEYDRHPDRPRPRGHLRPLPRSRAATFRRGEDVPRPLSDSDDEDERQLQPLPRFRAATATLASLHQAAEGAREQGRSAMLAAVHQAVDEAEEQGRPRPQIVEFADDIVAHVSNTYHGLMENLRRLQRDQAPSSDIIAPVLLNGEPVKGIVCRYFRDFCLYF